MRDELAFTAVSCSVLQWSGEITGIVGFHISDGYHLPITLTTTTTTTTLSDIDQRATLLYSELTRWITMIRMIREEPSVTGPPLHTVVTIVIVP